MDNRQLLLLPGLQSVYSPSLLPANTHNKKQKTKREASKWWSWIVYLRFLYMTSICSSPSWFSEAEWLKKKSNKTTSWNKSFVPAFYKVRKLSLTPGGACEKSSSPQAVADLSPLLIKDQSRQTRGNFQKKWRRTHLSPLCAPGATPAGHHNLCLIANLHLQRWLSKGKAATLH